MTSLRVICGLGPPNQKSWLRLWFLYCIFANEREQRSFEKTGYSVLTSEVRQYQDTSMLSKQHIMLILSIKLFVNHVVD